MLNFRCPRRACGRFHIGLRIIRYPRAELPDVEAGGWRVLVHATGGCVRSTSTLLFVGRVAVKPTPTGWPELRGRMVQRRDVDRVRGTDRAHPKVLLTTMAQGRGKRRPLVGAALWDQPVGPHRRSSAHRHTVSFWNKNPRVHGLPNPAGVDFIRRSSNRGTTTTRCYPPQPGGSRYAGRS